MSETTTERVLSLCDGCGASDPDPKVHMAYAVWQKDQRTSVTEPSFHFDCLPAEYRTLLDGPQNAVTRAAIEAAESGVHGEALVAFIQAQPDDNQVPPAPEES